MAAMRQRNFNVLDNLAILASHKFNTRDLT